MSFLGDLLSPISGVLSFLGGERRNDAQDEQADQANELTDAMSARAIEASSREAALNRDFQGHWAEVGEKFQREQINQAQAYAERMSNSAWQRSVADMKLAGINPILAYSKGGASSPSGSTGAIGTPSGSAGTGYAGSGQQGIMHDSITPALQTAWQAAQATQQIRNLEAQVGQTNASTALLEAQAQQTSAETKRTNVNSAFQQAQTRTEAGRPGQVAADTSAAGARAARDSEEERQLRTYGRPGFDPGSFRSQGEAAAPAAAGAARGAQAGLNADGDRLAGIGRSALESLTDWARRNPQVGETVMQTVRRLQQLLRP